MTEQPTELVLVILPSPIGAAEVAVDAALEQVRRDEEEDDYPYGPRAAWEIIGEIRSFDQPFALAVLPDALIADQGGPPSWTPREYVKPSKYSWRGYIDRIIAHQGAGIAALVRVTPHSDHPRPVVPKKPSTSESDVIGRDSPEFDELASPYFDKQ